MTKIPDFNSYAARRMVIGVLVAAIGLGLLYMAVAFFKTPPKVDVAQKSQSLQQTPASQSGDLMETPQKNSPAMQSGDQHDGSFEQLKQLMVSDDRQVADDKPQRPAATHDSTSQTAERHKPAREPATSHKEVVEEVEQKKAAHDEPAAGHDTEAVSPVGVAFVNATIAPLDFELNERFWGWRPNDIVDFTDNINNFQLGVLEVTRRTIMVLSESISRTGSTAAFDANLENSINWFMIRADKYWFPSAESKYKAGIEEIKIYREKLIRGEANFYTRADNLIPLLVSFQNLLGSCDENLVKTKGETGNRISSFKADDYLYYAKGVADAMETILKAIEHDFHRTIVARNGEESLHHAIQSCKKATDIDPWIVLESDLSGMLANHRANLATSISHARFYLDVLIRTLST